MTDEELSISDVTLIARLRNTPNWMREGFQNWKDNVRTYDTAPFEAADRIEQLVATNEALLAERKKDHANINLKADFIDKTINQLAEADAKLAEFRHALLWCSGSADFNEGGVAREGWLKVCAPLLKGESHE